MPNTPTGIESAHRRPATTADCLHTDILSVVFSFLSQPALLFSTGEQLLAANHYGVCSLLCEQLMDEHRSELSDMRLLIVLQTVRLPPFNSLFAHCLGLHAQKRSCFSP